MFLKNSINKVRAFTPSIVSLIFLLLIIFHYHLNKHLTDAVYAILILLIPVTFLSTIIYSFISISKILRKKDKLSFGSYVSTTFSIIILAYTFFSPYRLDSESLEAKTVLVGTHEGTQNFSFVKFRENKTFEIVSSSFFSSHWYTGNWESKGDTFYLTWDNHDFCKMSDTSIIFKDYLIPLDKINDTDSFNDFNRYFRIVDKEELPNLYKH